MEEEAIAAQLEELVTPAVLAQEKYYRQLGMRDRILNLPLMVAAVLTLIWRDVAGVRELSRILAREGFLWCEPTQVSQQGLSQRFLTFPAEIFERVFTDSYSIRDRVVKMGAGTKTIPCITMRLVEIRVGKTWCSYATFSGEASPEKLAYLTSVLDPLILPPDVVADLYGRRWRIEEAFNPVKRLLGLSYIWTGSLNGIQLQLWGTWLFYAVLVDLGDAVAAEVSLPFDRISLEMIYRGIYHFYVAHHKGLATDPVKYFAAPENQDLGVVKSIRKPFKKLIIDPFPERVSREGPFFFEPSSPPCLTTALAP
nr:transposase [Chamaesiphon sp. OTE_20_metabat_361]